MLLEAWETRSKRTYTLIVGQPEDILEMKKKSKTYKRNCILKGLNENYCQEDGDARASMLVGVRAALSVW